MYWQVGTITYFVVGIADLLVLLSAAFLFLWPMLFHGSCPKKGLNCCRWLLYFFLEDHLPNAAAPDDRQAHWAHEVWVQHLVCTAFNQSINYQLQGLTGMHLLWMLRHYTTVQLSGAVTLSWTRVRNFFVGPKYQQHAACIGYRFWWLRPHKAEEQKGLYNMNLLLCHDWSKLS